MTLPCRRRPGADRALASAATLCRFENRAERDWAWAVHEVLAATFIASFERPPEEIVLDMDATDDAVHGHQEGRFFHGYYDRYASCRCMCSPAITCWWPICGRPTSTRRSIRLAF